MSPLSVSTPSAVTVGNPIPITWSIKGLGDAIDMANVPQARLRNTETGELGTGVDVGKMKNGATATLPTFNAGCVPFEAI